ncbi:MAG: hypothetical protein NUK57_06875 [Gudongella sp.]|nr:hypothetical protein [Gudongella sp.]
MEVSDIINMIEQDKGEISRIFVLEELYWSDLNEIDQETMVNTIIPYVLKSETKDEIAGAMRLYGNPDGAHLELFQDLVLALYSKDPLAYIEAATDYPSEGLDTLYIFRNKSVFNDVEREKKNLLSLARDDNIKTKIEFFFRMYDKLCHT